MKILFFLPMILFFGVFLILIIGFLLLVAKLLIGAKNSSWTGTVVDKVHNTKRDFEDSHKIEHFYVLVVKTDQGKQMKLGISRELFDQFSVGDKIKKVKGSLLPEKVV